MTTSSSRTASDQILRADHARDPLRDPDRARETVEVHEEMIRALRARDGTRYRTLVLGHVSGPLGKYRQRLSAQAPAGTPLIGVPRRRARRGRS